jgi:hypothetical protein
MSENSELTRPLIDALNQTGGLAMRMNSGKVRVKGGFMQLHEKGTADILFFPKSTVVWASHEDGRSMQPVWIETKNFKRDSHKDQREAQEAFRARVEALGHRYIHATTISEGMEALEP